MTEEEYFTRNKALNQSYASALERFSQEEEQLKNIRLKFYPTLYTNKINCLLNGRKSQDHGS